MIYGWWHAVSQTIAHWPQPNNTPHRHCAFGNICGIYARALKKSPGLCLCVQHSAFMIVSVQTGALSSGIDDTIVSSRTTFWTRNKIYMEPLRANDIMERRSVVVAVMAEEKHFFSLSLSPRPNRINTINFSRSIPLEFLAMNGMPARGNCRWIIKQYSYFHFIFLFFSFFWRGIT